MSERLKDQERCAEHGGDGSLGDIVGPRSGAFARSALQSASQEFLLRALVDFVPDYLFVKDLQSRFVTANPAVANDLGLEVAALIGKTDFDLHPRELAE